jgi:hypothetical protein
MAGERVQRALKIPRARPSTYRHVRTHTLVGDKHMPKPIHSARSALPKHVFALFDQKTCCARDHMHDLVDMHHRMRTLRKAAVIHRNGQRVWYEVVSHAEGRAQMLSDPENGEVDANSRRRTSISYSRAALEPWSTRLDTPEARICVHPDQYVMFHEVLHTVKYEGTRLGCRCDFQFNSLKVFTVLPGFGCNCKSLVVFPRN